jgi:hypothetical protein
MLVKPSDYEELLAEYSDRAGAIALLRRHRPYLELIPSLRRPEQSVISIPLPVVRLRHQVTESQIQSGKLRWEWRFLSISIVPKKIFRNF